MVSVLFSTVQYHGIGANQITDLAAEQNILTPMRVSIALSAVQVAATLAYAPGADELPLVLGPNIHALPIDVKSSHDWPYGPFRTQGRNIVNYNGETVTWAGVNWPMSGLFRIRIPPLMSIADCESRRDHDPRRPGVGLGGRDSGYGTRCWIQHDTNVSCSFQSSEPCRDSPYG